MKGFISACMPCSYCLLQVAWFHLIPNMIYSAIYLGLARLYCMAVKVAITGFAIVKILAHIE